MGQRLVLSIEKNGKEIANIYFHWSAYTISALYETRDILKCIYNHKDETEKEMLLRLIRYCENYGGGIAKGIEGDEWKYIQNLYPNEKFKAEGINRSYGLIALSEKEMADSHSWSEGDVIIDLDEELINFGIYAGYEDFEEFKSERMEWDEDFDYKSITEIPDIGYDLGYIKVSDIDKVIAAVENVYDGFCRYGNEIFELTE